MMKKTRYTPQEEQALMAVPEDLVQAILAARRAETGTPGGPG